MKRRKVEGKENAEGKGKAYSQTESSVSEKCLKRSVILFGNFGLSQRKSACPARVQKLDDDEDDRPLAQRDHSVVSYDGDDQPLVQPAPRKEPAEERRDPASHDGDLAPLVPPRPPPPARRRKGPPVWQDPTATLEQAVSGDSSERAEDASILGKRQKVKLSATLSTSWLKSAT